MLEALELRRRRFDQLKNELGIGSAVAVAEQAAVISRGVVLKDFLLELRWGGRVQLLGEIAE